MNLRKFPYKLFLVFSLTTLIFAAVPPRQARAASIVVNTLADTYSDDGLCTLREAIVAARYDTPYLGCPAGSGDDEITFSVTGTITLGSGLTEIIYSGTPQAITIDGGNNIIIDGEGVSILLSIMEGDNTLENIEMTDGLEGIDLSGGSLTLIGVTLSYFSYAVFANASASSVSVTGSTFHDNGAGIYNTSTSASLNVSLSTFEDNSGAGAITHATSGILAVDSSDFINNTDNQGGAAISNTSTATITNSTFSGNSVSSSGTGNGGAVSNCYGSMTISDSVFDGNSASGEWAQGGAVSQPNCSAEDVLIIEDSLFINNSVTGVQTAYGGAIYIYTGDVTLSNLTLSSNSAVAGGAIFAYNASWTDLDWSLNNSTVYGNTSTGFLTGSIYCFDTCSNFDNNIFASSVVGDNCARVSSIPGTNISTDSSCSGATVMDEPRLALGTLGDYGGLTHTIPLLPGSEAIDSGNYATCASADQRGIARPQGAFCDVGAYESRGFTLAITEGASQSALIHSAFPNPLALSIGSVFGEPVDGGRITFSAPSSGASTTFAPTTTETIAGSSVSLPVTANGGIGSYIVTADAAGANPVLSYNLENTGTATALADFDGDGDTDVSVYRPSNGRWYIEGMGNFKWGLAGDLPVPGDYDGDGTTDIAIFRPSNGKWYLMGSAPASWGATGDIPLQADYTGDGSADKAVLRTSTKRWYIEGMGNTKWYLPGDIPVPCDYNGDGSAEIAIFRPSNNNWYVMGESPVGWGQSGDIPVPADYDGDGACEIAVFRPSNGKWYVEGIGSTTWGITDDIPVPGDYDGDGDTEYAVLRPSNGKWYIKDVITISWYASGDFPLPVRDTNADGDVYQ